jgi:hypothetical protein
MAPELYHHHLKGAHQPTEMVNHELMVKAPGASEPQDARKKRMEHKKARMANV